MTTGEKIPAELARVAADAVRTVPGVAFLRPGFAELLRASAASRAGRLIARTAPKATGVRVRPVPAGAGGAGFHLDLQLVARTGHRTADVTRAVRAAVRTAATEVLGEPGERVTVTVTVVGIV
ncbi:Asp23/Gls24 family envelope stress response protein [Streptomyces sp. NPDC093085]|uniref:Asp23/Gls24 family envelope stress response protein n=1 Tax=Streptomyces sp. NPDC093085 TaxID=3155068 RepID=UPI003445601F